MSDNASTQPGIKRPAGNVAVSPGFLKVKRALVPTGARVISLVRDGKAELPEPAPACRPGSVFRYAGRSPTVRLPSV